MSEILIPISRIDAAMGSLFFREILATELAAQNTYEQTMFLLTEGVLPSKDEEERLRNLLDEAYQEAFGFLSSFTERIPKTCEEPLHVFLSEKGEENETREALLLVAAFPVLLINSWRIMQGNDILAPIAKASYTELCLHLLGAELTEENVKDFQSILILHMDDPDNPSLAALISSLQAGNTLRKSLKAALNEHVHVLHHGAGTEVMRMVERLKNVEEMQASMASMMKKGQRIFGLGHRIYQTIDPRARFLKSLLKRRATKANLEWLPSALERIEREGSQLILELKGKRVFPNVDLYNAATYMTFGIDPEFNTALFAIARIAGWFAHACEIKGWKLKELMG